VLCWHSSSLPSSLSALLLSPSLSDHTGLLAPGCEAFCCWILSERVCLSVRVQCSVCVSQSSSASAVVVVMYRDLSDRDSEPQGPGSESLGSSMSQDSQDCLGSMTQESQDIYLRMDHHRRRSGYRLGRIIARQQLLRRIAGGRRRNDSSGSGCCVLFADSLKLQQTAHNTQD
jgi:hypothetical protein